jgi:hypothetical protein
MFMTLEITVASFRDARSEYPKNECPVETKLMEDGSMSAIDWAKKYAAMDGRVTLKYQQLPKGEQIGKHPAPAAPEAKKS